MARSFRSPANRAFSLLEVLVASVILMLVVILFAGVFSSAQNGLTGLTNSVRQRQDARVVLANMARELRESLTSPSLSYEGNDPEARQFQLLINPPGMGNLANADTIFWSTASSGTQRGSSVIGYAVRWDLSTPSAPRPRFCRMSLPVEEAQVIFSDLKNSTNGIWASKALMDAHAPADAAEGYQGWLADNILALFVRPLDPLNQPIVRKPRKIAGVSPSGYFGAYLPMSGVLIEGAATAQGELYENRYDSRIGYQYSPATSGTSAPINRFGPVLPPAIEIALVACSPDRINRITNVPSMTPSTSATNMWSDIAAFIDGLPQDLKSNARTYSTIVTLSAAP